MIPLFRWVIVIGMGCFVFVFILLLRNVFLPRYPYEVSLRDMGLSGEEVSFQSRDGVELSGTLLLTGQNDPLIIFCHGVGANRYDLIESARALYEKGSFNIFLFDFRAHGKSGGHLTSFGLHEQKDLLGALDYLDTRKDLVPHYGLYGVSMGGSVGILVAAEDPRIRALCVDSPFVDLKESITSHIERLYSLPRFPFATFAHLAYTLLFLTNIRDVSPVRVVHKISPRPLFVINGAEDDRMTPQQAKRLYEKASEPKQMWLVPGAAHLEGRIAAEDQYDVSLLTFFATALRRHE